MVKNRLLAVNYATDYRGTIREAAKLASKILVNSGTGLRVQAELTIEALVCFAAFGAQVSLSEQPNAGKGGVQFIDEPLGNGCENLLKI